VAEQPVVVALPPGVVAGTTTGTQAVAEAIGVTVGIAVMGTAATPTPLEETAGDLKLPRPTAFTEA
jgi:hypothetical protein